MDGETNNDTEGVFGSGHDGPTSELGGTVEEAKGWEENNHAEEHFFPFFEPLFSVWEKVTYKS